MNIKDRLINIKQTQVSQDVQKDNKIKGNTNICDLFADGKYVQNLVKNYIKDFKNIIFIADNSFDLSLISQYLKSFINNSVKVKNSKSLPVCDGKINIIDFPSVKDVVKIFENIIRLDKSFIFGFKLKSIEQAIEKLKLLISINCPNLSGSNIEYLMAASDLITIYFTKNEEGLYIISKIEELHNVDGKANFEKIFDYTSSYILSDEKNVSEEKLTEEKEADNEVKEEVQEELQTPQDEPPIKKLNKYKLLRNKIKNKDKNAGE